MNEIFDFMKSALPWIAIGLFIACSCASAHAEKGGNKLTGFFKGMCWSPAVCFLFVAIMEFLDGNKSSGTTWLVLSVFNTVLNFANTQKEDE